MLRRSPIDLPDRTIITAKNKTHPKDELRLQRVSPTLATSLPMSSSRVSRFCFFIRSLGTEDGIGGGFAETGISGGLMTR
jgi:hypothetical protein